MKYKYANYKDTINKITKIDNIFKGDYTVDPYQNCEFGCKYCDSTFENVVYIKNDFIKKFEKEIKLIKKGTIILGSVVDPYQKIESELKITRKILDIIYKNGFNVHILTKSDLILRDLDILSKIENSLVTISIISLNNIVLNVFEKDVPSTNIRLNILKKLLDYKIRAGLAIMPLLPYIIEYEIEEIVKEAKANGAQYVLYKFLELKGDQKTIFMDILEKFKPNLIEKCEQLYYNSYQPKKEYITKINEIIEYNLIKNDISSVIEKN